jgi:hypothetical protein
VVVSAVVVTPVVVGAVSVVVDAVVVVVEGAVVESTVPVVAPVVVAFVPATTTADNEPATARPSANKQRKSARLTAHSV